MHANILTLLIPAMMLIFGSVFIGLWVQNREKSYIFAYAAWFFAIALGISLQAWIFKDFGPLEVIIFHAVSCSGLIAMLWGLGKRDGRPVPLSAFILFSTFSGVVVWIARMAEQQAALLMVQNANAALLFAMGAYGKWLSPKRELVDKLMIGVLFVLAAYSLYRPGLTIIAQSQMTMAEYQSSIYLTINIAATGFLTLLISLALIAQIVTDLMKEQREEARFDSLSGLRLRGVFEEEARAMLAKADRQNVPVSMIMTDIDFFKKINDNWGHSAGDLVIAGVGKLISTTIRDTDIAGRMGGEEFCILVWNCRQDAARNLADRLRRSAGGVGEGVAASAPQVTISLGVAELANGEAYSSLFERADEALYRAKRTGRNRVVAANDSAPTADNESDVGPISIHG